MFAARKFGVFPQENLYYQFFQLLCPSGKPLYHFFGLCVIRKIDPVRDPGFSRRETKPIICMVSFFESAPKK